MNNMWRFLRAGGAAGMMRSRQQQTSFFVGSSLLVGGGLLLAQQNQLSLLQTPSPSSPSPSPSPYFDFRVLAEESNPTAAEEAIRNAARIAFEREQEEKKRKENQEQIARSEEFIRNAAKEAHQREQEEKKRKEREEQIARSEESIRNAAKAAHQQEEEDKKQKKLDGYVASGEDAIRKEAQAAYERENDPRAHPHPEIAIDRNDDELKRVAGQQVGLDEFEVYRKWKTYLDELAKEQEAQIKEQYDQKMKDMEEFVNKKMYQKIFKEKEILEDKFKEQYRQAIQNLKGKFAEEKKKLHNQTVENQVDMENNYMTKVADVKSDYLEKLLRLEKEAADTISKIEKQVGKDHSIRVEEQKELMKKFRQHTAYQKKVEEEYEQGKSKVALSLAALSLVRTAVSGQDYNLPLDEMAACAKDDKFLTELVKAIPRGVGGHGVPSIPQLQVQFAKVVDQAFYDTIMGNDASYWSYAKSRVVGNTLIRKRGLATGNTMEDALARGEYYLGEGDLEKCLEELQKVQGTAQVTLACWIHEAKKRQETLLALEAIEAYVRVFLKNGSQ